MSSLSMLFTLEMTGSVQIVDCARCPSLVTDVISLLDVVVDAASGPSRLEP